jgi:hypothetical protein
MVDGEISGRNSGSTIPVLIEKYIKTTENA